MKDRIKSYMDFKGISAGEFAIALDVQRSNVSHILNGRNMPGAAFIEKMLLKYPDINARWLLTGVGSMIEGNRLDSTTPIVETRKEEELTSVIERKPRAKESVPDSRQLDKIVLLFNDGTFIDYRK